MLDNFTNPIDQFVSNLLVKANLSDVSIAKREEYHQNILGLVQQKLGIETMKIIPTDHMDEFITLTEKQVKPEVLHNFFQKVVPDFDKRVVVILQDFENDFMTMIKQSADFLANRDK